jgi:hypothetical protein
MFSFLLQDREEEDYFDRDDDDAEDPNNVPITNVCQQSYQKTYNLLVVKALLLVIFFTE